jgi:hypothetical protein
VSDKLLAEERKKERKKEIIIIIIIIRRRRNVHLPIGVNEENGHKNQRQRSASFLSGCTEV